MSVELLISMLILVDIVPGVVSWMDTHLGQRALSLHAAFLGSKGHLWQHCQICADSSVRGKQMQGKIPQLMKHRLGLQDMCGCDGNSILIKSEPLHGFSLWAFFRLYIPSVFPVREPDDNSECFCPL